MEAAGLDTTESAVKIREWQEKEKDFLRQTGLKRQSARSQVGTYGRSDAGKVNAAAKKAQEKANSIFNLGSSEANLRKYLKEKPVIDLLDNYGIKYIHRISAAEIIVDAGKPKITSMREHAIENLLTKPDRINMTLEQAQAFVDNSKLTLYQQDRMNLKYLAADGYAIVNLKHELVTAVPQKWRKKYDKYL